MDPPKKLTIVYFKPFKLSRKVIKITSIKKSGISDMVSGPSGFRKVWKIYAKKTRFYIRLFTYFKAGFPQIAEFRSTKILSLLKYCKNLTL